MQLPTQCVLQITPFKNGTIPALEVCGGQPFLGWLMREYMRFGIRDFVLLADPALEETLKNFCRSLSDFLPQKPSLRLLLRPAREGLQDSFVASKDLLEESYIFAPAHVLFDGNLSRFIALAGLRRIPGGILATEDGRDTSIRLYTRARVLGEVICGEKMIPPIGLTARMDQIPIVGTFYDLAVDGDFARADTDFPTQLIRPAVFFDRDGVLNVDYDMVSTVDRFTWMDGALAAVRAVRDAGMHAFIVTNQGAVGHGAYTENDVNTLHAYMQNEARKSGAGFDDIRYCPFHPTGEVKAYRGDSDWRKPNPGMVLDLMEKWHVNPVGSLMIGDKGSDVMCAKNAGIPGHLFTGANLANALIPLLPGANTSVFGRVTHIDYGWKPGDVPVVPL